jgi:hypothetical protein
LDDESIDESGLWFENGELVVAGCVKDFEIELFALVREGLLETILDGGIVEGLESFFLEARADGRFTYSQGEVVSLEERWDDGIGDSPTPLAPRRTT